MISYIIPTLWKSPNIFTLIKGFESINDPNAELIIINNDIKAVNYKPTDKRIRVFQMDENQFVNPSWQLGFDYSTQGKIAIVNDDIIFNIKRFHEFVIASDAKAICMTNWNRIDNDDTEWALVSNNSPNARPAGGGQLMMVNKEN